MSNIEDAISAGNGVLIGGLQTGDAAACAAAYTTDAHLMFQHTPTVTGHDAIQAFWQGVIGMGAKDATLVTDELLDCGDTQVDRGRYTLTLGSDGGDVTDEGKYVVVWKQEGGAWKIHWDSFSSDLPA